MGLFDFFGSGARKDLKQGYAAQQQALNTGASEAIGTQREGETRQLGFYNPYAEQGLGAQNLYSNYLGVNGQEAQQGFFDDVQFGPGFEAAQDYGIRALDRSAAARGGLYSGGQMEALQDFGMTNFQNFLNPYTAQLERASGQGANIAQQQAGVVNDTADYVADTQFGKAQLDANNAANFGSAMAANRQVGMNNILGLGQLASSVYGGMGVGRPQQSAQPWVGGSGGYDSSLPWMWNTRTA